MWKSAVEMIGNYAPLKFYTDVKKKPHSQEVETVGQAFLFFQEVLKKILSDPPATASLRWLLIYRILQEKYTWCSVNFESTLHETELCKDA